MREFLERLSSRKWILTLTICAYFMIQGESAFPSLTQVVIAFLAIEGGADALARVTEARITRQPTTFNSSPEIPIDTSNNPVGD